MQQQYRQPINRGERGAGEAVEHGKVLWAAQDVAAEVLDKPANLSGLAPADHSQSDDSDQASNLPIIH